MRVLLAFDDSPVSLDAARAARRILGADHDYLAITVGRLVPAGMAMDPAGYYSLPPEYWDQLTQPDPYAAQQQIESVGLGEVEVVADSGDPVRRICEMADAQHADVIVVGAHDKGFWRRLVDPSVSEGVVHHSDVPVLVVPEPRH